MAQNQKNVTKADMISEIASRTGLTKRMSNGYRNLHCSGQGGDRRRVFHPVARLRNLLPQEERPPRKTRNISKGTTIEIPAHETPAYKPSKEFADSIRNQ